VIVNAAGIVLSRRSLGEYDRLCAVYTETLGKVPARFVGVNRAAGKLKALTEPGVWGEYRLHLSPRSEYAKGVGGRLVTSFPGWRNDLGRVFDALALCEMLDRLTPDRLPDPAKFRLLASFLAALEERPSAWLLPAFGLRLAHLAGFSLRERPSGAAAAVWERLHEEEPAALADLPSEPEALAAARRAVDEHLGAQIGRRLRSFEFREAFSRPLPQGVPA
jgi:DNA repair protein RecO (recombination protein O)